MSIKNWKRVKRGAFRFMLYGGVICFAEVAYYTVSKLGMLLPDWLSWFFDTGWRVDPELGLNQIWKVPIITLYGQVSLWMFFVSGFIFLFILEPAHRRLQGLHWFFRGSLYSASIILMECLLGWLLYWLTGYQIWYYEGRLSILTYSSLAVAPLWFVAGLLSENISRLVFAFTSAKVQLAILKKEKDYDRFGSPG